MLCLTPTMHELDDLSNHAGADMPHLRWNGECQSFGQCEEATGFQWGRNQANWQLGADNKPRLGLSSADCASQHPQCGLIGLRMSLRRPLNGVAVTSS